jgi:phosphoglycolate phosphatase-like HAD superfamily hydrolase
VKAPPSPPSEDESYLRVLNPQVIPNLGHLRHALFDFDGTLSVLREGWESVMIPLMIACIRGPGSVSPQLSAEIEQEVRAYVDRSTGILTIQQMGWLAEAVRRYGLVADPCTAREYKAQYVEQLMQRVSARRADLRLGRMAPEQGMLAGARSFLEALTSRGTHLYLASGTDHPYVVDEASALGLAGYFDNRIYGALDDSEANDKEQVIRRILDQANLAGTDLLVVGDGPVEIRVAHAAGAIALGVASDEVRRSGWNAHKVRRLEAANADLLVPDFSQARRLAAFLFAEGR